MQNKCSPFFNVPLGTKKQENWKIEIGAENLRASVRKENNVAFAIQFL